MRVCHFFGRKSLPPAASHRKWRRALTSSKWPLTLLRFSDSCRTLIFLQSSLSSPSLLFYHPPPLFPFHRRCPARSLESAARQRRFEETRQTKKKNQTQNTLEALSKRRCTTRLSTSLQPVEFRLWNKTERLGARGRGASCLFVYEYKMIKHTTNLRWQARHLKGG